MTTVGITTTITMVTTIRCIPTPIIRWDHAAWGLPIRFGLLEKFHQFECNPLLDLSLDVMDFRLIRFSDLLRTL